ncbi:MAG: flagellar type III secretion system pore protein FliP [Planctomicrobium sp.]|jgi:flagellar biosynthesis protein FliP|nr:flagellar type III secretion system pore protein FliP [Planctomicrobium sp.]
MGSDKTELFNEVLKSEAFQDLSPQIKVALFLGALTFLSSALVTMTAFTRIVIVLSFVRRALSTQEIPPTQVIIGLSLFLTMFVMAPTFSAIEKDAVVPYLREEITSVQAVHQGSQALKAFMITQTRKQDIQLLLDLSELESLASPESTPMHILVPAFVISELKTSFIMGFCIYLPFVLIDLVISVILMALGMMMMPPVVISTPCKLLLFILIDGWNLIIRSLSLSFG